MYHQVLPLDNPHFKDHIVVTPEVLEAQVSYLKNNGWSILTVKEYFSYPRRKRPSKIAILSFDDISSTFIDYAKPVLDRHGVKGSLFPIQNMTESKEVFNLSPNGIKPLTKDEIKFLFNEGHEIGSHCQSHRNLHKIPFAEAVKEMKESKEWIESITKESVETICFPIGGINQDLVKSAKELGYINGLSTFKCALQLPSDRMALRRINIKNDVLGKKLKNATSPFYGFRRFLTRPFRAKYKVTNRHEL